MTQEEKAKRYDEAIEKAKEQYNIYSNPVLLEYIFPELKESEDERISKEIRDFICWATDRGSITKEQMGKSNLWLAWLEKQGEKGTNGNEREIPNSEQKPADKVEPKFHKGDWIVHQGTKNIYQVVAIIDNQYQLKYGNNYTVQQCAGVDRCARLWDITKDAKKGDILRHNNCTFIFICIEKGVVKAFEENLYNDTEACNFGEPDKNNDYSPATKEQRDLLLQRMKDVGYEWDAVKKELKKIEQKPTNNQFTSEQADVLDKHIDKFLEQKQGINLPITPSEYINDMGGNGCYLKNTVQASAWSEEDEKMFNSALWHVKNSCGNSGKNSGEFEVYNWLKSIKDRYTWKPSDGQMRVLDLAIRCGINRGTTEETTLVSLFNDLKKLK